MDDRTIGIESQRVRLGLRSVHPGASDPGLALVNHDAVALAAKLVGSGEACRACSDHSYVTGVYRIGIARGYSGGDGSGCG